MSASGYVLFRCDTCSRETEITHDPRRPDPVRCNITAACRGKLQRRGGVRSTKRFLVTPPVVGLEDFVPRGTIFPTGAQTAVTPTVNLFTSSTGIMVLAMLKREVSGPSANFFVTDTNSLKFILETQSSSVPLPLTSKIKVTLFELTPEILIYRKYTYQRVGAVQIVQGSDDTPEGKNLRFTSTNNVKVLVNGIELDGSDYDRSINDQITFSQTILTTNNVIEIFVYDDIDTVIDGATKVELTFGPLEADDNDDKQVLAETCWGDHGRVEINNTVYNLLYSTDISSLVPNKSYGVSKVEGISSTDTRELLSTDMYLLLGQSPFSFADKDLYAYITGTSLITDDAILTYETGTASGELELLVPKTSITEIFNPLEPSQKLDVTSSAPSVATVSETVERRYIIGPT